MFKLIFQSAPIGLIGALYMNMQYLILYILLYYYCILLYDICYW